MLLPILFLLLAIYVCLALLPSGSLPIFRGLFAVIAFIPVAVFFALVIVAMDGRDGLRDVLQHARRILFDLPSVVRDLFSEMTARS